MSEPFEQFQGKVGLTIEESEPWWSLLPEHEHGPRPNILIILFDDMGFAHLGCYGSTIETPNIDKLAAEGLRYSNFHVTPLCSPTRASLLTGRNHHAVGMRTISFHDTGFTNMRSAVSKHSATLAEMLQPRGYATHMVGKWHLSPAEENGPAGPYDHWPLQRGFDRYYGFLSGATDQFYPELTEDNHHVTPPKRPEEGYHLTEDLVDHAIQFLRDKQSHRPDQPFFTYLALGAVHEPHQSPREYVEKYRGRFDAGWDDVRQEWYERQLASGIIPPDTELAARNPGVERWQDLSDDAKRFAARLFEAFGAFLDHTDAQLGRLFQYLEDSGQLDNTIVMLTSDNGASGMGGPMGMFSLAQGGHGISSNEGGLLNIPMGDQGAMHDERLAALQDRLEDVGTVRSWTDVPWGWAQVANTPLRWYKSDAYGGGIRVPLIIRWPERVPPGQIRNQFHHITDLVPTVLDVLDEDVPRTHNGLAQMPVHGKSLAYSFGDPEAPSNKGVQYFEMWGHRAIWMDGWKAVTRHFRGIPFAEDQWELFNLEDDFSELHDRSTEEPDRLQRMIDRWWIEAGRYNVLPLDDRLPTLGRPSSKPGNPHEGLHYRFYPPVSHLHGRVAPVLHIGDWEITVEVERSSAEQQGVLYASGSMAGGISIYVQNNRLCLDYNSRENHTIGRSDSELPTGKATLAARMTSNEGTGGIVAFSVDGRDAGRVQIPDLAGIGVRGGADVGADQYSPVSESYEAPFEFSGTIHVVDVRIVPTVELPRVPTPEEASEAH